MSHKINSVKAKDNLVIEAVFLDGTIKEYDVKEMFDIYPPMRELENESLFKGVHVDTGGYGISWNDDLDLEAETIWEEGKCVGRREPDLLSELASRLSDARSAAGVTQKQLAEKTGIYQADISKIERGIGNPSLSTLKRLANGMGMTLKIEFQK